MQDVPGQHGFAREQWAYRALAALLVLLWLTTLAARPLFNPDEGRYAEIPREMLSGGDWVVPHLNGLAYIEKPPLQYWATALSYRVLGVSEFAARIYCALTAMGTVLLVWLTACRLWGRQAGWRAVAVLSGMLIFVVLGQLLTLDMSLTFYMTSSLVAFLLAQQAMQPRRWMLLAWAAAALGVLTKGLVAAAIPAAVLILYSLYARDFTPWRRLCAAWGLPLFFTITVPWHWLAARRLDDFLQFFFIHEHVARYLTPIADRREPWWFFGGVFLAGTMPWTLPALRVLAGGWRKTASGGAAFGAPALDVPAMGAPAMGAPAMGAPAMDMLVTEASASVAVTPEVTSSMGAPVAGAAAAVSALRAPASGAQVVDAQAFGTRSSFQPALLLWIWIVFVCVFFSLSDSKLMPYILPVMPALALLISAQPVKSLRRDFLITAILTVVAGVSLGAASLHWPSVVASSDRSAYFLPLAGPLKQIALLLTVSGVFVLVRCARDATRAAVFLGVGWCLAWLLLIRAAAMVAPIYSGVSLAAALPEADRDAPLYSVGTYDQSVTFYLRRTLTLVGYRGELDYGLRKSPDAQIADVGEFIRRWSSQTRAFAVMEKSMFDDLNGRGVPMRLLAQDVNRVLVARQ